MDFGVKPTHVFIFSLILFGAWQTQEVQTEPSLAQTSAVKTNLTSDSPVVNVKKANERSLSKSRLLPTMPENSTRT